MCRRLIKPPLQGEVSPKVTEGCIAALRRKYPANSGRTPPYVSQGTLSALRAGTSCFALRNAACGRQCLHRPGKPCDAANPKRRAKTPALHCGREWVAMHKRQPSARPVGGPMRSSAPAQRGGAPQPSSTRHACCSRFRRPFALHCRAGVHARRGALRQPGRILIGQDAAPLSRLTPTAPLTGEPSGGQAFDKASPARGGVTEGGGGVHCRFASEISCKPRQNPALCFVGGRSPR